MAVRFDPLQGESERRGPTTPERQHAPVKRGLRERKRIERRLKILESAAAVFRRKSFDDARIEEIAVKADVSAGTVYNYFPTKDALLLALADHYRSRTPEMISEIVRDPPKDPVEAFKAFYSIMTRESLRYLDKALWRHVHAATTVSGWHQHGSERWQHEEDLIEHQCELIKELQRRGAISDTAPVRPLAEAIHASAFFWWQRFLVQDPMSQSDFMANLKANLTFILSTERTSRRRAARTKSGAGKKRRNPSSA